MSHRTLRILLIAAQSLMLAAGLTRAASAQVVDVTIFGGLAFPLYDERIGVRNPSFPGVEVTVPGSPDIRADGGAVFGGAVGVSFGVLGIEGRVDATQVG